MLCASRDQLNIKCNLRDTLRRMDVAPCAKNITKRHGRSAKPEACLPPSLVARKLLSSNYYPIRETVFTLLGGVHTLSDHLGAGANGGVILAVFASVHACLHVFRCRRLFATAGNTRWIWRCAVVSHGWFTHCNIGHHLYDFRRVVAYLLGLPVDFLARKGESPPDSRSGNSPRSCEHFETKTETGQRPRRRRRRRRRRDRDRQRGDRFVSSLVLRRRGGLKTEFSRSTFPTP